MSSDEKINQQFLKAYDRYADAIFRHCYFRVGSKEFAEELTQEVFIRAWKFLAKGGAVKKSMQAFLYRVARNIVIDFVRQKKDVASLELLRENGFEPAKDDRGSLNALLDSRSALSKLSRLEAHHREILIMRYVEGLPPRQIAEIMQLTPNVASVRIHRAKEQMKKIVDSL